MSVSVRKTLQMYMKSSIWGQLCWTRSVWVPPAGHSMHYTETGQQCTYFFFFYKYKLHTSTLYKHGFYRLIKCSYHMQTQCIFVLLSREWVCHVPGVVSVLCVLWQLLLSMTVCCASLWCGCSSICVPHGRNIQEQLAYSVHALRF